MMPRSSRCFGSGMGLSMPSVAWAPILRKRSRSPIPSHRSFMSDAAIETEELKKIFGDYTAVKGLTLRVPQGEVFGFLGPNGAGKTTSIKMLLGLVTPSSGSASLLGARIGDRPTLARGRLAKTQKFALAGRIFI